MLKSIQGLRAVAALLVVIMHQLFWYVSYAKITSAPAPWLSNAGHFLSSGAMGVHIFFVISGFVMGIIPAHRGLSAALHFLRKRLVRIAPMYWLATLAALALSGADLDAATLARSLLFVPPDGYLPILGVGWSLNFEMFFYLIIFAGLTLTGKNIWFPLCVVVAVSVLRQTTDVFAILGNPIILEFAAGLVASQVYKTAIVMRHSSALAWLGAAGLAASVFLYSAPETWHISTLPWWGLPSFLLVLGCAGNEARGRVSLLATPLLQELGGASYSIYLTHTLLFFSANWYFMQSTQLAEFLPADLCVFVLVLMSVALGEIVHHLIERPLLMALNGKRARFPIPRSSFQPLPLPLSSSGQRSEH